MWFLITTSGDDKLYHQLVHSSRGLDEAVLFDLAIGRTFVSILPAPDHLIPKGNTAPHANPMRIFGR